MEGIMNALLLGLGVFIFTTTALFVLKNLIGGSITTNAWKPNVPYTRLVSESIKFTGSFLADNNIKKYPPFKIYYYKHRKFAGVFNTEVVIYLKSNPDIPSLVNTVLHEVMHYAQSQTDKQYKHYHEFTDKYGYWKNPFEIQARAWAAQNCDSCIRYLAEKQLIIKHVNL